jgi:hypothetical protein
LHRAFHEGRKELVVHKGNVRYVCKPVTDPSAVQAGIDGDWAAALDGGGHPNGGANTALCALEAR